MSRAYVLLSGGLDSSTLLYRAIKEFDGDVCAVSVFYGQRHSKEMLQAQEVVQHANKQQPNNFDAQLVIHTTMDLSKVIGVGGLTDKGLDIPKKSYDELEGISPTYVPFRNGLLLSALASKAQADPEAQALYYGAHAEDAQNWAYPDCAPEFIGAMANAIFIGTYQQVRLHTPYMWYRKDEIVSEGIKLGVPYELTWSCYEGGEMQCGECPTCLARKAAFAQAGVTDPTQYASDPHTHMSA